MEWHKRSGTKDSNRSTRDFSRFLKKKKKKDDHNSANLANYSHTNNNQFIKKKRKKKDKTVSVQASIQRIGYITTKQVNLYFYLQNVVCFFCLFFVLNQKIMHSLIQINTEYIYLHVYNLTLYGLLLYNL